MSTVATDGPPDALTAPELTVIDGRPVAMRSRLRTPVLLAIVLLLATSLAACSGVEIFGIADNGTGGQVAPDKPDQGGGGGVGGGVDGNPGNGVGLDLPAPAPDDPLAGMKPSIEEPKPGQVDPQPVSVVQVTPSVDGRQVQVLLAWWGGAAPCSVLDSVDVDVDAASRTITLTPREGADPAALNMACPAIAMLRGTIVDLGELEPGAWTLAASGDLAPIAITIE